jgi:hypothetical protein
MAGVRFGIIGQRTSTPSGGVESGVVRQDYVGRGLTGLGEAVERVDDTMYRRQALQAEADARAAQEGQKQADEAWWAGQSPALLVGVAQDAEALKGSDQLGPGGHGYTAALTQKINERFKPYEDQARTPGSLELVRKAKTAALTSWGEKGATFEREQFSKWAGAKQDDYADQAVKLLADVPPAQLNETVEMLIGNFAKISGQSARDPGVRAEDQLAFARKLADAALQRQAETKAQATGSMRDVMPAEGAVPDAIRAAARSAGVDPQAAMTIALLENPKFDPEARPTKDGKALSTAHGLFQITDRTWKGLGGSDKDRADPRRQIELGLKNIAQTRDELKRSLGRDPQGWELYLGHQQGAGGAAALLAAPGKNAVDVLTPFYSSRAEALKAVVDNGGAADTTAGAFAQTWQAKYAAAEPRAGQDVIARFATPEGRKRAYQAAEKVVDEVNKTRVAALDIAVDRGLSGHADIKAAVAAGWLDAGSDKYTSLVKKADDNLKAAQEAQARSERVDQAIRFGVPLDPRNHDDLKAADEQYRARAQTWKPEEMVPNTVAFARQIGVLPETVQSLIRRGVRATDPQRVRQAVDLVQQLRGANPALLNDLGSDELVAVNTVANLVSEGMEPGKAVETMRGLTRMNPEQKSQLAQAYGQAVKGNPAAVYLAKNLMGRYGAPVLTPYLRGAGEALSGDFEGAGKSVGAGVKGQFFGGVGLPPALTAEFDHLSRAFFLQNGGDLDAARQTALDVVSRTWGRSEFGDTRLMKWAPETMFSQFHDDRDARWQREQLRQEVFNDPRGTLTDGTDPMERVRLILHPSQPFDAAGRPAYAVMMKDPNGSEHVLMQGGEVLRWQPDWASSPEARRQENARKQKAGKAKAERDRSHQINEALAGAVAAPALSAPAMVP